MIFISSSHHRLKSQVLLQQQKEKKQAKYLTTVTITNKLSSLRLCPLASQAVVAALHEKNYL